MLCKKEGCPGDMKFFKIFENDGKGEGEGYRCPICGYTTRIVGRDIEELNEDLSIIKDYITYDENGCLCIDDDALEAYLERTR